MFSLAMAEAQPVSVAGAYTHTALHELGHATGHPSRLNRPTGRRRRRRRGVTSHRGRTTQRDTTAGRRQRWAVRRAIGDHERDIGPSR